jgi:hypothetical protein
MRDGTGPKEAPAGDSGGSDSDPAGASLAPSSPPACACPTPSGRPVRVTFDGGRLTSDGGLPWLAEADAARDRGAPRAAGSPAWRRGPGRHRRPTGGRLRVVPIACGGATRS